MTTKTATTNGNVAVQEAVDKAVAKRSKKPLEIALRVEDLDLGDCIDVEEATGMDVGVIFSAMNLGLANAKALTALVWVARRKTEPSFTFEDAKRTKVMQLGALMGVKADAGEAQG